MLFIIVNDCPMII